MELDKRSYTARQLYHLSPSQLHHATYRVLIGHAPADWLVQSNKHWRSMAKQVLVSTNALIDKEVARAGNLERRARHLARNLRRFATSQNIDSSRDLPRLNFPPAEAPTVNSTILEQNEHLEHQEYTRRNASLEQQNTHSSYPSQSPTLSPSPEPAECDLDTINADADLPKFEQNHNIRHYIKRMINSARADKRYFHRKRGEILFAQQFLVQIRETRSGARLKELNSIPASIIKERFREYTAVARYTGRSDVPVAVYLYATDEVTRKVDHRWSRALKHKIYIDSSTKAAFFDSMDFSIAVWNCHKRNKENGGRVFFLFMSQSVQVQISWLYFLMHSAGCLPDPVIHIKIPDLNVSLQMRRGSIDMDALVAEEKNTVTYTELVQPDASPSPFIRELHRYVLKIMAECSGMPTDRKFTLCWRNIDFIRMIFFENNFHATSSYTLLQEHILELRPVHTLTTPQEPPPIEGFCWRLTTWRGQGRKQKLVTRNYFHTHNHLLFHLSPTKTILPDLGQGYDKDEDLRDYFESMPTLSDINPYPLDADNNIEWCVNPEATLESAKFHDARALYEVTRGASNIEASDGFIDMTEITGLRVLSNPQMFEITIAGESNVLIRVAETEARDAWVSRLEALVKYWTAVRKQLKEDAKSVYEQNLAQNTNFIRRSNVESNFATPNISSFNIELMLRTRPIVYSNYLYQKSHKHGFFRKYYAVLTSSSIALYNCKSTSRSMSDISARSDTHFTAHLVFDLLRSYVYSGILAHDYLSRESEDSFDFAQMYNGVPRVFENGWVVKDREADCCFVLWSDSHSKKNRSKTREGTYEGKLVCMARSRIERDLWISALQNVTTALSVVRDGSEAEL